MVIQKEDIKDEYSFKITAIHNETSDKDSLRIKVSLTSDLINLLKSVIVNPEESEIFSMGCNTLERYKIKKWVLNSCGYNEKCVFFIKELIDNGEIELLFNDGLSCNEFYIRLKESLKYIIESITKILFLDYKIVISVIKPKL